MKWDFLKLLVGTIGSYFLIFLAQQRAKPEPTPQPLPPQPPPPMPPPPPETASQKVYDAAKLYIGRHLTLDNSVPEELGCVEALSYVFNKVGYNMPPKGIPGVNAMVAWMLGKGFVETTSPYAGCIIVSHRPNYNDPNYAHIGVVMNHGICSNSSANGLWEENYTLASWYSYFAKTGGATVRFFTPSPL